MTGKVWIEMPAVQSETEKDRVQPKYPVLTNALLMYKEEKVYILFEEENAREQVEQYTDCRRLTPNEAIALEESLPFPVHSEVFHHSHTHEKKSLGLGDIVAWLTRKVGIEECGGCRSRKMRLNKLVVWGWWRR